jgi:hypothetical protein
MRTGVLSGALAAALVLGLSSCTNPYDPGQRALGGAALGAGTGAAIGAAAGGGGGAATGALIGGALGAAAGVASTPPPPAYGAPPPPPGYGYAPPPPRRVYAGGRCGPGHHWLFGHMNR